MFLSHSPCYPALTVSSQCQQGWRCQMYSVSLIHTPTHIYTHSTPGLEPTQETNFQFTVEWEISLPTASTISLPSWGTRVWQQLGCLRICAYLCVHACAFQGNNEGDGLKSRSNKKREDEGEQGARKSKSFVFNELILEMSFNSFLQ